jgi:hypothetical protein
VLLANECEIADFVGCDSAESVSTGLASLSIERGTWVMVSSGLFFGSAMLDFTTFD